MNDIRRNIAVAELCKKHQAHICTENGRLELHSKATQKLVVEDMCMLYQTVINREV
jgi:hypothetical protein